MAVKRGGAGAAIFRIQTAHWQVFLPLVFMFIHIWLLLAGSQSVFAGKGEQIPLLISDHHADHGPFMLRYFGTGPDMSADNRACMVVLDAHTDTVKSDFSGVVGNHNWICPLYPFPLASLVWIHTIAGFPNTNSGKVRGFYFSISEWGSGDPQLNAFAIGLDRVSQIVPSAAGLSLFVSLDLDFFCIENNTPADIPYVFDTLFDFASRWQGKVIWALALSRPWLPNDEYAWDLLRQSLRWFSGKTEFAPPELTLFTVQLERYKRTGSILPGKRACHSIVLW